MQNDLDGAIVGRCAVCTTLSAGAGGVTVLIFRYWRSGALEVRAASGGVLLGAGGSHHPQCRLFCRYSLSGHKLTNCTSACCRPADLAPNGKPIPFPVQVVHTCNGILAGLVGVTAGCVVIEPWAAIICGCGAGLTFYGAETVRGRTVAALG